MQNIQMQIFLNLILYIEKDYGINLKIAIWAGKEKEVYLLSLMNICLEKDQIVLQKIH